MEWIIAIALCVLFAGSNVGSFFWGFKTSESAKPTTQITEIHTEQSTKVDTLTKTEVYTVQATFVDTRSNFNYSWNTLTNLIRTAITNTNIDKTTTNKR